MIMRTFKISDRQALRLSNRAAFEKQNIVDLVQGFIDQFLSNPIITKSTEPTVLRSFYLTKEQDTKLKELAQTHNVTKGALFRIALDKGLGTYL